MVDNLAGLRGFIAAFSWAGRPAAYGAILLLAAGGCKPEPKPAAKTPPAVVTVSLPVQREVIEYIEATGTTEALASVDIRARVKGFLEKTEYTPRQRVEKDTLLFVIDQRPYKAKLDAAKADLQAREVQLEYAKYEYERTEALAQQQAAAELERKQNKAKYDGAVASVEQAKAALFSAQVDYDFTTVKAPISGTVSKDYFGVGNLISEDSLLATIVNDDSVYANFNFSEQDILRLRRRYPDPNRASKDPTDRAPAYLGLMDERGYPHVGWVDYIDTKIDSSTGTLYVRGLFPNTDRSLFAGLFVRVRIPVSKQARQALMVSERALGLDQGQRFVYVANKDNAVEYRRVLIGTQDGGLRVIEDGLHPTDRVIVNGVQRVRPGVTVDPKEVDMLVFVASSTQPAATSRPATVPSGSAH